MEKLPPTAELQAELHVAGADERVRLRVGADVRVRVRVGADERVGVRVCFDELRVLTVGYRMGAYDDKTVALKTGPDGNEELWHVDKFAGVRVFAWDRDASKLHELYDMFDFAAPDAEPWLPAETTWTKKSGCECSGNESLKALDYHHVSSISVGLEGSLLVSSRNLNTVFALDARVLAVKYAKFATMYFLRNRAMTTQALRHPRRALGANVEEVGATDIEETKLQTPVLRIYEVSVVPCP